MPGLKGRAYKPRGRCRVQASVSAAPGSLINFEVWIPERWNGKLVVTGNGGYGNTPSTRDMQQALAAGYAAIGGDTGHQTATPDDLLWGAGHPERIIDWGSRSIHAITEPGRRIVERGRRPGGPALVLQRLLDRRTPGVRGDSALSTGLRRGRCRRAWQQSRPHKRRLPLAVPGQSPARRQRRHDHPRVEAADDHRGDRRRVRCDDGVRDGIVDDPRSCRFDPAVLQCRGGSDGQGCLTARAGRRAEHDVRRGEESTDRRTDLSRLAEEQRSAHGVGRRTAAVGLAAGTGGRRSRRA